MDSNASKMIPSQCWKSFTLFEFYSSSNQFLNIVFHETTIWAMHAFAQTSVSDPLGIIIAHLNQHKQGGSMKNNKPNQIQMEREKRGESSENHLSFSKLEILFSVSINQH